VAKSIKGFVDSFAESPIEEQPTIAVLVPRNQRGVEMVNALRQRGIEPIELISSTSETRAAAGALSHLLSYLSEPGNARKLAKAYEVYRRDFWNETSRRGGPCVRPRMKNRAKPRGSPVHRADSPSSPPHG
jgi:hypothetical protein